MEELENEISTQAEENTVSLASAQALADALAKIEVYTPTTWVDNSSPDIDAEHLNKPEQAIKRVTDALNSAVDVIKDLQSQVTKNAGDISTVNNNLSKKLNGRNVNWFPNGKSLATIIAESVEVSIYGIKPSSVPTESIPGGFGYGTLFVVGGRGDEGYGYGYAIYNGSNATGLRISAIYDKGSGWNEYVSKSDLLNLSRTFVSGDSFSDAKDLSIPPGIYGVNPGLKNIPENTYGLLEVTADTVNNWRFLKFTPTNIKSHYLMFYNGYDKTWSEWAHFASTT